MSLREAYARSIAGSDAPRARFIELQLEIRSLRRAGQVAPRALSGEENRLLMAHRLDWIAAMAPMVDMCGLRGGFIEYVSLYPQQWLDHASEIFALEPIIEVRIRGFADQRDAILARPELARLHALNLAAVGLTDDDGIAVATCPRLAGLKWLQLDTNQLGMPALEAIAEHLTELRYLGFRGNRVDPHPTVASEGHIVHYIEPSPVTVELRERFGPRPWMASAYEVPPDPANV